MSALKQILTRQKAWAEVHVIHRDSWGYAKNLSNNLFQPLSALTFKDFQQAGGHELRDRPDGKPAKMRALESSSALLCNFFDFWRERNIGEIGRILMIPEPVIQVSFEVEFRTRLRGTPPTLDLVLTDSTGAIWGIEAKFCEPYRPKAKRLPFAKSYFPGGDGLWAGKGLARCERLARDMHERKDIFDCLDVAQLLKHALGLYSRTQEAHLWYLWYEEDGSEANAIRSDLDKLTQQLDPQLNFQAVTYQELYKSLQTITNVDARYVEYLSSRYFIA